MADLRRVINELNDLSVEDAAEIARLLEQKRGIGVAGYVGDQIRVAVILQDHGRKKINMINEVREITGLGLREAKDLVEHTPAMIVENISGEEADRIIERLCSAGGQATYEVVHQELRSDEFTEDEWIEIKRQALEQISASLLDSPEHHLAYIRERVAVTEKRHD
jgi:large subunit ribosomal protein L7/L12